MGSCDPWNGKICDPWGRKPFASTNLSLGPYTDADLAADMNAMSFVERQAMEADIHGVHGVIEEKWRK